MPGVRVKSVESMKPGDVFLRRTRTLFHHHKARAAKYGYALPYTLEQLRRWLPSLPCPCEYCEALLTEGTFGLDHDWAVGRRVDSATWALSNLVVCCDRCNQCKDRLTANEFAALMDVVLRLAPQAQTNVLARLKAGARRVAGK